MKRIITALGNQTLNYELKKYSKYDVVLEDLFYQEAVLDINDQDIDVMIVSSILQGQYAMLDFIKEIKKKFLATRVILIVDTITEEEKNILVSKGVFDILYDNEVDIQDIIEAIDREEPINIKAEIARQMKKREEKGVAEVTEASPVYITQIQKQEVIAVYGTAGSGKSTVLANMVKFFAKKTNAKILVIDLDTLSGNLDEVLQIEKVPKNVEILLENEKKCGINYMADLVLKNRFDANVLEELVMVCKGFDVLTGNTSLHYCQNVLNENCYQKLLDAAKEKYDFIFLDLSSNIFLDATKWALQQSSKVLFVTEDSRICLKKATQQLDLIVKGWNIWKNKIQIILNKVTANGIDGEVFEGLTKLKVIGSIAQNATEDKGAYDKILETLNFIPKKSFFAKFSAGSGLLTNFLTKKENESIMEQKKSLEEDNVLQGYSANV